MRNFTRRAAMFVAAGLAVHAVTSAQVLATQAATVEQVLQAAGAYVTTYERAIAAVTAQEDYQQLVVPPAASRVSVTKSRKTRAYLLVIDMGQPGWVAFRDVFEVDGQPVRERDERLSRLLTKLTPDSLAEARRIAAESARYNLNGSQVRLDRTINTPVTPLLFLRTANQSRSTFRLGKTDRLDGASCVALNFTEQAQPRIIGSGNGAPAQGTFCIDTATGRVLRSELRIDVEGAGDARVLSRITVKYAHVDKPDLWLPVTMDELYDLRPSMEFISGHAEYSDFRQFAVTTGEGLK